MELLLGWPIVSLSKVAVLTLSSHDLTLVKRRQFYEPFLYKSSLFLLKCLYHRDYWNIEHFGFLVEN